MDTWIWTIWLQYFSVFLGGPRKGDVTTACYYSGRTNSSAWCSNPAMGQSLGAEGWAEWGKAMWKGCVRSLRGCFLKRDGGRSQWVWPSTEMLSHRSFCGRLVLSWRCPGEGNHVWCPGEENADLADLIAKCLQNCWLQGFRYLIYVRRLFSILFIFYIIKVSHTDIHILVGVHTRTYRGMYTHTQTHNALCPLSSPVLGSILSPQATQVLVPSTCLLAFSVVNCLFLQHISRLAWKCRVYWAWPNVAS